MPVNIKELIDNGYIVICDTNVYLHIYRFSPEFSDFALRCMQAIQSGIIMPSTVRYEFLKHYRGYFSKMEKRVQNVGDDTKKQISNAARKVLNLCDNLQSLHNTLILKNCVQIYPRSSMNSWLFQKHFLRIELYLT